MAVTKFDEIDMNGKASFRGVLTMYDEEVAGFP